MKRRDHYHVTPSMRKKAWAAHERAKARVHKHVCEWCPADDVYTCTKAPCQHLKKKPCPTHKWNAKKGIAPERLEFTMPPPVKVTVDIETIPTMGEKYPLIMVDMAAVEKKVVEEAVIGQYADWGSNTLKFDEADKLVEDENGFVSQELKQSAEEMGKKMVASLNELIEDEDGAPYPDTYQGKGLTAEKIEEMIKAGDDASEYAKYEDFI